MLKNSDQAIEFTFSVEAAEVGHLDVVEPSGPAEAAVGDVDGSFAEVVPVVAAVVLLPGQSIHRFILNCCQLPHYLEMEDSVVRLC